MSGKDRLYVEAFVDFDFPVTVGRTYGRKDTRVLQWVITFVQAGKQVRVSDC